MHVVTVNDYLAKRDSEWMGQIYNFLGLSVGVIVHGLTDEERRVNYAADVTYGTNNEFGFDYLRDNMKYSLDQMAQRGHHYAIVDEVDSILVDEARTPLIISGPTEDNSELYKKVDALIPHLAKGDFELDEKQRQVSLTEEGNEHMVELLRSAGALEEGDLYDINNIVIVHHVNQALRAHKLFQLDKDYIVKDDKVVIIDEFTGRMMEGRRYSDGLHQALEAKEHVAIQSENVTLASITFQNYFRLYGKLAGMTGTAMTEAAEFMDIYNLDVVEIPTNMPVGRADSDDEVYRTDDEKHRAIVTQIAECLKKGQPVLVGTVSIEKSETLDAKLKDRKYIRETGQELIEKAKKLGDTPQGKEHREIGEYLVSISSKSNPIPHNVLNARYHEQEAYIVAQAGRSHGVTIATNMAGRGTDIQLGGNPDMRIRLELGDITDEAERARRIAEDQGRSRGRQGKGHRRGRALHPRHRAPRKPAHRQSAPRPFGPPGRPRRLEILPEPAGRSDAHLRVRAHGFHPAAARPRKGRSHRASLGEQGARKGAAKGRSAQFRNPQEPPEIRQCAERSAQSDLRAAPRHHARGRGRRDHRRHAHPGDRGDGRAPHPRTRLCRTMGRAGPGRGSCNDVFGIELPVVEWSKEEGIADEEMKERIAEAVSRRAAERADEFRARSRALSRKGDPAPDAGPRLARAHHPARALAPICGPARLRPARSVERI